MILELLIVLAIVGVVALVVTAPLRSRSGPAPACDEPAEVELEAKGGQELAELESAREAKYREIRDAELDHRTGKLSDADYEAVDLGLRAEAIEILRALDRTGDRATDHATDRAGEA
ncbi:MAG: hypothetical protein DLM64_12190 [Solirubrobacterales bacterium]|nr:MAG: hypothetical protein DLM64_12190 [Solirubrobacterales bacterium]